MQVQGQHPHQWAPFQVAGLLLACKISHQISRCLSWGSIAESFHSLQSLSVSYFHVILGLQGPRFPSTCMWKAVLIAPLECSTCPYQRSLHFFRMRSRSSMPSRTSTCSSLDLVVTMSCGFTLQICLIIALSFHCRRWRFGFVNGQVSLAWSIALHTQELYMRPPVLKRGGGKRELVAAPWTSSRRFSHMLWLEVHSHRLLRACLLGSKRKLPLPAWQVQLWLPYVVCHPRGVQFPGTMYICNQGPLSSAWAHCISCAPSACSCCRRCCCCPLQCNRWCIETCLNSAGGPDPYHRLWSLSFLHLLSVLSPPSLLSKSRASWHIPRVIQQW